MTKPLAVVTLMVRQPVLVRVTVTAVVVLEEELTVTPCASRVKEEMVSPPSVSIS